MQRVTQYKLGLYNRAKRWLLLLVVCFVSGLAQNVDAKTFTVEFVSDPSNAKITITDHNGKAVRPSKKKSYFTVQTEIYLVT
ncbi:MAG: hypothetical protein JKX85_03270 [Phycisphaeraceae bacterium]|nr:hypothetical protein [Phycisphaeraceae bacterium]